MTRRRRLVALGTALAVLLALLPAALAPAQGKALEDLMMELNIAPFEPQAAPPLSVVTLDGVRVSLAEVKGQAVLVYFWATW